MTLATVSTMAISTLVLIALVSAGMLSVLLYPMLARVRPQRVRDREEAPGLGFLPVSG